MVWDTGTTGMFDPYIDRKTACLSTGSKNDQIERVAMRERAGWRQKPYSSNEITGGSRVRTADSPFGICQSLTCAKTHTHKHTGKL